MKITSHPSLCIHYRQGKNLLDNRSATGVLGLKGQQRRVGRGGGDSLILKVVLSLITAAGIIITKMFLLTKVHLINSHLIKLYKSQGSMWDCLEHP